MPQSVHQRRTSILGLALLVCVAGTSLNLHAAELCHRPSPQTLINWYNTSHPAKPLHYDPRNSAIYHPISIFRSDQPAVYWIGLAWLSPVSGALFAVNCAGQALDAAAVGAIGKMSAGPVLPQLGQTVMVIYVSKETTDCVHDAIQIAAFKDNRIISLWEHDYNQGLNVHSHGKGRSFIAKNYNLNFADRGLTIRIGGTRAVYAYRKDGSQASVPSATHALETETWRWNANDLRFMPDKTYRRSPACTTM